jgi:hypothetical protein
MVRCVIADGALARKFIVKIGNKEIDYCRCAKHSKRKGRSIS